jgi:alkylation response protein AidB-like acyl-CoA dehydrogenase
MPALPFPRGGSRQLVWLTLRNPDAEAAAFPVSGDRTVTYAVAVVGDARSLTGNHGLTRANPLERYYRDARCGRVHTPQDDATRIDAGRLAFGI